MFLTLNYIGLCFTDDFDGVEVILERLQIRTAQSGFQLSVENN